ncbi:hypothetical protein DY251_19340 [Mesorhizobium denitrificans]|jgi:hypothetical protein|uniref:Uncharacterized protein n=2 Tax=Mesorhizobium denitrificans TaxID=2294114 RepID=A0A371X5X5_9HYPH|nr:hypothetical protein DY251_19340 [Mesorhizobium denitrificans]
MSNMMSMIRFLYDRLPFHIAMVIVIALPFALYAILPIMVFKMLAVATVAPFITFLVIGLHAAVTRHA